MLCQSCGQNTANTHIKSVINGELTEHHLCSKCAAEMGYSSLFEGMSMSNLIGSFFGGKAPVGLPAQTDSTRCDVCGSTFGDIVKSGQVGCAGCYTLYHDSLMPTVQRIHGNTRHVGKIPASMGSQAVLRNEIDALKNKLREAVAAQDYENAAVLRDQIKAKEKEAKNNE